jgi:hypothetical protein
MQLAERSALVTDRRSGHGDFLQEVDGHRAMSRRERTTPFRNVTLAMHARNTGCADLFRHRDVIGGATTRLVHVR